MALTKRTVDAAEPRSAAWFLWDEGKGAIAGFGLRVSPGGSKAYILQYRMSGAKNDRRYTIGRHGPWTPDKARDRAAELRRLVDTGVDPFEADEASHKARERERVANLERAFDIVADNWLASYQLDRHGKPRRQSSINIAATVVRHLKSQFGSRRIDELGRADIIAALDAIAPGKVGMRSSVFSYGRILWKWAFARELVDVIPFAALSAPAKPVSRDVILSDAELAIVWRASRKVEYPFGPAFRLLLLTGQRRSEVFGMRWEELDGKAATWTIPADRAKNAQAHVVPLSDLAVAEITAMLTQPGKAAPVDWPKRGLLFSTNNRTPASGISKAKLRLDAAAGEIAEEAGVKLSEWRLHDLRRTVATGLQKLGVRLEVTEAVLNHISGSKAGVVGIYQRHDWAGEKREALDLWARHVSGLIAPKVVEAETA
ncbi:MAG: integrase arm-type DNA-binding domain-containing protein [Sphingopyxis terrae]|nr:integrase arm-type DNA-binding domain-containing protein [Sphingopyxis terrae]